MVEHLYVKYGDPSCIGFWNKNRQTDRQTNAGKKPPRLRSAWVITSRKDWKYDCWTVNACPLCRFIMRHIRNERRRYQRPWV